jgi:hypothetical protein
LAAFHFFHAPTPSLPIDGQTFIVGPQGRSQLLLSMALKPLRYAYDNKPCFTVTPDTILPHPHSMSLATTIFEGPSESRQELKATTLLTARNSKKTCR